MGFVDRGRFFLKIPLGSSHATWWSLSVDKHHRLHTSRRNPGINVTETREASRIHSREGASSSRRTSCRPVARRVVPRSREASWALGPRSVSHPAGDLGSREAAKARRIHVEKVRTGSIEVIRCEWQKRSSIVAFRFAKVAVRPQNEKRLCRPVHGLRSSGDSASCSCSQCSSP